jgi:type I restriction enzyme S subunit
MERQYKDSGLMWIGKIPETWKVDRFKNKFKTGKGLNITKGDLVPEGIPVVSYGQIHSKQNTGTHLDDFLIRYIPSKLAEEGVSSKVSVGDFIFADTSEDIDGCGNAVYVDKEIGLYAGYHSVIAFAKHPEESKYYAYLFLTECWRSQIRMRVTGIKVFSISQAILNETTIILPPLAEQQRIADFLDKKCGEIDALIALQEQMIAQLTDYKQSVITEIVTKGLIPDAQLVPSGIDWIAVIPKGWKNVRFYYSNWIRGRLGWKGLKSEEYTESGYPFLSAFNIINNKLDWSDINYINQERYDESPEIKLKVGDILLVKDGAGIGKCARIDELPLGGSTVNSSLAVITPKAFLNYKYLYYYLQSNSFWSIINLLLVGMGVPHLTQTNMKNIKMPLPPLEEQVVIAEYLDAKCGEIDRLIETKRQKIETLKEYKKSVIYEAVTGKTDLWDS